MGCVQNEGGRAKDWLCEMWRTKESWVNRCCVIYFVLIFFFPAKISAFILLGEGLPGRAHGAFVLLLRTDKYQAKSVYLATLWSVHCVTNKTKTRKKIYRVGNMKSRSSFFSLFSLSRQERERGKAEMTTSTSACTSILRHAPYPIPNQGDKQERRWAENSPNGLGGVEGRRRKSTVLHPEKWGEK